jgi:hypothetical protein
MTSQAGELAVSGRFWALAVVAGGCVASLVVTTVSADGTQMGQGNQSSKIVVLPAFPTANPSVAGIDGEKPSSFYPAKAERSRVDGDATAACKVSELGKPTSCTWTAESPPDFGFGPAGAKAACFMRFKARPAGSLPENPTLAFPIHFATP